MKIVDSEKLVGPSFGVIDASIESVMFHGKTGTDYLRTVTAVCGGY